MHRGSCDVSEVIFREGRCPHPSRFASPFPPPLRGEGTIPSPASAGEG
ncbi:hypothetical protein [Azospirillum argentinense]